MRARVERFAHARAIGHHTHGEAAADALGKGQQVGLEPNMLKRKHAPRAAKARLDFIDEQKRTPFATNPLRGVQEVGLAQVNAALALDNLDHDRCSLVGDGGF